jgi:hypothetical protein
MKKQQRSIIVTEKGLDAFTRHLLSKVDSLVFWHLVKTLPVAGAVVSKAVLEKELKTSRVQLTNVIKRFCEAGFLIRGPRMGVSYHYKINPMFIRFLSLSGGEES